MNTSKPRGPKPDLEKDQLILQLLSEKRSFRYIAKIMKLDVKSVYRRYKRAIKPPLDTLASYPQSSDN